MKMTHSSFKLLSIGLAFSWLFIFVMIPNGMIFVTSFLTQDTQSTLQLPVTWDHYLTLFNPRYGHIFANSIYLASITSIICLLIGYPTAWLISSYRPVTQRILLFMLILPFWTNSLIRTYAIKIILSAKGLLNTCLLYLGIIDTPLHLLYTQTAVIIGFVYILIPFMVLPLYNAIEKLPSSYSEAAKDLGASRWQYFYKVMLPLTYSGIIAGILMVFLPTMGMFYLSDLLGGSKNLLIGNLIKDQLLITRNWPLAASASMSLLWVMALLLFIYFRTSKLQQKRGHL
tara:strand:+ start:2033 stop:2890 length:858 start_codon:yes stop_codon:yes gene_type:complete